MRNLVRYWFTITTFLGAAWQLSRQYRPRVWALQVLLGDRIDAARFKRIKSYAPVFLLIEYFFQLLWNKPFSKAQQQKSLIIHALTPLVDDLTDEWHYDGPSIKSEITGVVTPTSQQAATCAFLFETGNFIWNPYWESILIAQANSRRQQLDDLTFTEIVSITFEKGAASVELGWHTITEEMGGEGMRKIAARFGAFSQLLNDVFDVYKDREAGVRTLMTTSRDIRVVVDIYTKAMHDLVKAIDDAPASAYGKRRLIAALVPIYCLGLVALAQLVKLQENSGTFYLEKYTRQELVCDMAKWKNRMRWAWLILTWQPSNNKSL